MTKCHCVEDQNTNYSRVISHELRIRLNSIRNSTTKDGHVTLPRDKSYGEGSVTHEVNRMNPNFNKLMDKKAVSTKKVLIVSYYGAGYQPISRLIEMYPDSFHWPDPLSGLFKGFYNRYDPEKNGIFGGYKHRKYVLLMFL